MALFEIEDLTFRYPEEDKETLKKISLCIEEGSLTVLCGGSGSGKTTLLRHLKRELRPAGTRAGRILYHGKPLHEYSDGRIAEEIGMVFQHPDGQMVMDTVWHEMAFGLENRGYKPDVIRKRTAEIAQFFGLEPLLHQSVHHLSGGQKQLINLASVLVMQPRVLLLDEPTSQLDPLAAKEFLQLIKTLNEEFSMTIILSEHRLEEALPLADRVVLLEEGRVRYNGTVEEVVQEMFIGKDRVNLDYLPSVTKLCLSVSEGIPASIPFTVKEGRKWFTSLKLPPVEKKKETVKKPQETLLTCKEVTFLYSKEQSLILKRLNLSVYRGEFLAILGGNGAGKSTLLQIIAGLLEPQRGKVKMNGKKVGKIHEAERFRQIGYLAQNPLLYFVHDTLEEELAFAAKRAHTGSEDVEKLIDLLGLSSLLSKHPYDLSGGQQQKAALAIVLLPRPSLLLLDEPTKGLDVHSKRHLAHILQTLRKEGVTMAMVTHDIEFAAKETTRCALLFDGDIVSEGTPREFFCQHYFYTTAMHRIVRGTWPEIFLYEEVMDICKGECHYLS